MKLLLISPAWQEPGTGRVSRFSFFPPLNLGILAALTPLDVEVTLTDENVQPIDFSLTPDLVGITCMTATAPRAYEIARRFRERGAKIVLGGIHPSSVPEEAARHADAVCVGEAEGYWRELVEDVRKGRLKPVYRSERPDPFTIPISRRDLFPEEGYLVRSTVQTTRGCPFSCDFCSVTNFFGHTYRCRKVGEVLEEISHIKDRIVAFVDDNIVGTPRRAKEFFKSLVPLKIRWFSQGSITMAEDEELLGLAKESGCIGMFMGFESLSQENLKAVGKKINLAERFERAIQKIHSFGIAIEGAFIYGLDEDDPSIFERTVAFARRMKLEAVQFGILTPLPGTGLFRKLQGEGRIFDRNWAHYDISRVVFKPKRMTAQELQDGYNWSYRNFYSLPSIFERLGVFRRDLGFLWKLNLAYRQYARGLSPLGPEAEVAVEV